MEQFTNIHNAKEHPVTYPEAVASSDAETLRSRTKLLVEVDDFIDAVLANLARKLFIFANKITNCVFT